jgi:hypothetical protein
VSSLGTPFQLTDAIWLHNRFVELELRHAPTGTVERLQADAVTVAGERRPRNFATILPAPAKVFVAGDAIVPRRVAHAISEGRAVARSISRAQADHRVAWSR